MSGGYLDGVWKMSGKCLEGLCKVLGQLPGQTTAQATTVHVANCPGSYFSNGVQKQNKILFWHQNKILFWQFGHLVCLFNGIKFYSGARIKFYSGTRIKFYSGGVETFMNSYKYGVVHYPNWSPYRDAR